MGTKKTSGGGEWFDPDDASPITDAFFDEAELFRGDTFVRKGPGRPKAGVRKERISVRLDPDVVEKLREAGPGWQSKINGLLRKALGLEDQGQRAA